MRIWQTCSIIEINIRWNFIIFGKITIKFEDSELLTHIFKMKLLLH